MAWAIDTVHSTVGFSVKHLMISTVRGKFDKYDAKLDLNTNDPSKSSVEVTIDASSINTANEQRDGHLKSPDFFDVAKYPNITFKSTKIEIPNGVNSTEFKVVGDLTILNVTKPVELTVSNEGSATNPFTKARAWAFNAHTTISRKEWGLTWNVALEAGGFMVSDNIKVEIELEVVEQVPTSA